MIDLEKLDKEIDELFKTETDESLTTWLINKRLGNLYNLIGEGSFINLQGKTQPVFAFKQNIVFNQEETFHPDDPKFRLAA